MCVGTLTGGIVAKNASNSETIKKAVPKQSLAGYYLRKDDKKKNTREAEQREMAARLQAEQDQQNSLGKSLLT